jgi:hypothetical protein
MASPIAPFNEPSIMSQSKNSLKSQEEAFGIEHNSMVKSISFTLVWDLDVENPVKAEMIMTINGQPGITIPLPHSSPLSNDNMSIMSITKEGVPTEIYDSSPSRALVLPSTPMKSAQLIPPPDVSDRSTSTRKRRSPRKPKLPWQSVSMEDIHIESTRAMHSKSSPSPERKTIPSPRGRERHRVSPEQKRPRQTRPSLDRYLSDQKITHSQTHSQALGCATNSFGKETGNAVAAKLEALNAVGTKSSPDTRNQPRKDPLDLGAKIIYNFDKPCLAFESESEIATYIVRIAFELPIPRQTENGWRCFEIANLPIVKGDAINIEFLFWKLDGALSNVEFDFGDALLPGTRLLPTKGKTGGLFGNFNPSKQLCLPFRLKQDLVSLRRIDVESNTIPCFGVFETSRHVFAIIDIQLQLLARSTDFFCDFFGIELELLNATDLDCSITLRNGSATRYLTRGDANSTAKSQDILIVTEAEKLFEPFEVQLCINLNKRSSFFKLPNLVPKCNRSRILSEKVLLFEQYDTPVKMDWETQQLYRGWQYGSSCLDIDNKQYQDEGMKDTIVHEFFRRIPGFERPGGLLLHVSSEMQSKPEPSIAATDNPLLDFMTNDMLWMSIDREDNESNSSVCLIVCHLLVIVAINLNQPLLTLDNESCSSWSFDRISLASVQAIQDNEKPSLDFSAVIQHVDNNQLQVWASADFSYKSIDCTNGVYLGIRFVLEHEKYRTVKMQTHNQSLLELDIPRVISNSSSSESLDLSISCRVPEASVAFEVSSDIKILGFTDEAIMIPAEAAKEHILVFLPGIANLQTPKRMMSEDFPMSLEKEL